MDLPLSKVRHRSEEVLALLLSSFPPLPRAYADSHLTFPLPFSTLDKREIHMRESKKERWKVCERVRRERASLKKPKNERRNETGRKLIPPINTSFFHSPFQPSRSFFSFL